MIRPAAEADVDQIRAIWNAIIRETTITFTDREKTTEEITEMIHSAPVLVAEEKSTLLGFATYGPFRSGPGYRFTAEHSIYLRSDVKGRGMGCAMLTQLISHARGSGITTFVAGIAGDNHTALKFHEKMGFKVAGRLSGVGFKFGQRQDLVLMQKDL